MSIDEINRAANEFIHSELERRAAEMISRIKGADFTQILSDTKREAIDLRAQLQAAIARAERAEASELEHIADCVRMSAERDQLKAEVERLQKNIELMKLMPEWAPVANSHIKAQLQAATARAEKAEYSGRMKSQAIEAAESERDSLKAEVEQLKSRKPIRIFQSPDHSRVLGVVCSKCGHEEPMNDVEITGAEKERDSALARVRELEGALELIESNPREHAVSPVTRMFCRAALAGGKKA